MMSPGDDAHLPLELRQAIRAELAPGEHVAWIGGPRAARWICDAVLLVLPGIPWTAFFLYAACNAWERSASPVAGTFLSIFFVAIGLLLVSSPIWLRRYALRTAYLVTDRRAVIFTGRFTGIDVRSFPPESLTSVERHEYGGGSGHLVFAHDLKEDDSGDFFWEAVGFEALADVRAAEKEVRALVASSPPGSG
jgi:hypothetical protein